MKLAWLWRCAKSGSEIDEPWNSMDGRFPGASPERDPDPPRGPKRVAETTLQNTT